MGSGIQKKVQKSILERVGNVESALQNLIEQINKSLTTLDQQISVVRELTGAVVDVVGVEEVKASIEAARAATAAAQTKAMFEARDAAVAALNAGLANGEIVEASAIGPRSVIVGVQTDAEGKEIPPGFAQILFQTMKPEFQAEMLGKGVGTVVNIPTGGTFTIQAIYTFNDKALEPTPPAAEPASAHETVDAAAIDELAAPNASN